MRLQKIEKIDWPNFLYSFSNEHKGWLVEINEYENDSGNKTLLKRLPLEAITIDLKNKKEVISIFIGNEKDKTINTHFLSSPQSLEFNEIENNINKRLIINSLNNKRTVINFLLPACPEIVDENYSIYAD